MSSLFQIERLDRVTIAIRLTSRYTPIIHLGLSKGELPRSIALHRLRVENKGSATSRTTGTLPPNEFILHKMRTVRVSANAIGLPDRGALRARRSECVLQPSRRSHFAILLKRPGRRAQSLRDASCYHVYCFQALNRRVAGFIANRGTAV